MDQRIHDVVTVDYLSVQVVFFCTKLVNLIALRRAKTQWSLAVLSAIGLRA